MTREDILFAYPVSRKHGTVSINSALEAMDEYARIRAIEFFKWYGVKMAGFIEYIKDVRPTVTSNEIEEKIKEFEGQPIDNLYDLFTQQNK